MEDSVALLQEATAAGASCLEGEVLDMLMSLIDFASFKEMMLAYNAGQKLELGLDLDLDLDVGSSSPPTARSNPPSSCSSKDSEKKRARVVALGPVVTPLSPAQVQRMGKVFEEEEGEGGEEEEGEIRGDLDFVVQVRSLK
jgi:hypothetical protein